MATTPVSGHSRVHVWCQRSVSEEAIGEFVLRRYVATLYTDQTLKVVETTSRGENRWSINDENQETVIRIPRLRKAAYDLLFNDVVVLADAEIQQSRSAIVCMLMPAWPQSQDHLRVARSYDYERKTFKGELLLVDGPHGCWLSEKPFPKKSMRMKPPIPLSVR